MTTDKTQMLIMCPEGERLYNYYTNIALDDEEQWCGEKMVDAWEAWQEHKKNCEECGYK